jgi:C1A family cysteine protease
MWKASPEYASVPDFREVKHLLTTVFVPSTGLFLEERTPISSQGSAGTCAANATCDACEQVMPTVVQLSRRFVYWNALRSRREETKDEGTDLYACFNSLKIQGACEESIWPYDPSAVLVRPSLQAYERGYDNRLITFYSIRPYGSTALESIDDALHSGCPVAFGLRVNVASFRNYKAGSVIEAPSITDGGHAMVIVGYKTLESGRKVYIFRNSWSTSWGDSGYGLIAPEYLASILYGVEFYVPIAVPLTEQL